MALKLSITVYFVIFVIHKLRPKKEDHVDEEKSKIIQKSSDADKIHRNTLMKILIWLDLDTIAKLFDLEGENSDSLII